MKLSFTLLFFFTFLQSFSQSIRTYNAYDNSFSVDSTHGVQGLSEQPGEMTCIVGSRFHNQPYYTFYKISDYANSLFYAYQVPGNSFRPTSISRLGGYLYVTALLSENTETFYGLLKISDEDGSCVAYKKISQAPFANATVKVINIPNTQNLLLSYHSITNDSISEISFVALNSDLQVAGYSNKISYPNLKSQGFFTTDSTYDFLMEDSTIHFCLVFAKGNQTRLETGSIHMNNATSSYFHFSSTASTASKRPSKIVQVSNDSLFYLFNNSLVVYPAGESISKHYRFNIGNNAEAKCVDLMQTPDFRWMTLYQSPSSVNGTALIGLANLASNTHSIHIPTPSSQYAQRNGNRITILGTYNSNSLSVDEFDMTSFTSCHPFLNTENVMVADVPLQQSDSITVSSPLFSLTNLPLATEVNFTYIDEAICNPNHYAIHESETDTKLRIFPNPAEDFIEIISDDMDIKQIEMVDVTGKRILLAPYNAQQVQLELSGLPSGIYIVRISTEKETFIKKISKR